MSRAISPSSGKPYRLALVCRVWRVPRATIYRHQAPRRPEPQRRGPVGPMPDQALLAAIRAVLAGSPFHGEGHRKVWARLRRRSVHTSRKRVLRLTREAGLLAPTGRVRKRAQRLHEGAITVAVPDALWATDATEAWSGEGRSAVFAIIDHASGEAWADAALRMDRFAAVQSAIRPSCEVVGSGRKIVHRSSSAWTRSRPWAGTWRSPRRCARPAAATTRKEREARAVPTASSRSSQWRCSRD